MTEVLESLVHLHGGAELPVRYYVAHDGVRIHEVNIGSCWVDPAHVLLPHVIDDAVAELTALESELAEYAE